MLLDIVVTDIEQNKQQRLSKDKRNRQTGIFKACAIWYMFLLGQHIVLIIVTVLNFLMMKLFSRFSLILNLREES